MSPRVSLLTAVNAESHVHLIIGSNSLAAARCGQSLAAGASPVLLAPEATELHYALQQRVDDGEVQWVKEAFQESHLFTLGRADIDHVVDAVFVTSGSRGNDLCMLPMLPWLPSVCSLLIQSNKARAYPLSASEIGFPSTSSMPPSSAPFPSSRPIPMALSRSALPQMVAAASWRLEYAARSPPHSLKTSVAHASGWATFVNESRQRTICYIWSKPTVVTAMTQSTSPRPSIGW